jgi:Domain of unknown function (DUF1707)
MLASAADRDRTIRALQKSFAEGRLTRDELDERLARALRSRDFPQLLALTADLPPAGPFDRLPAHRTTPCRTTRGRTAGGRNTRGGTSR